MIQLFCAVPVARFTSCELRLVNGGAYGSTEEEMVEESPIILDTLQRTWEYTNGRAQPDD